MHGPWHCVSRISLFIAPTCPTSHLAHLLPLLFLPQAAQQQAASSSAAAAATAQEAAAALSVGCQGVAEAAQGLLGAGQAAAAADGAVAQEWTAGVEGIKGAVKGECVCSVSQLCSSDAHTCEVSAREGCLRMQQAAT
jgi:hypothetical protein